MTEARPATQAYLYALLGRDPKDARVTDTIEKICKILEQAPETDENAMDALRTTLGDAVTLLQGHTLRDSELDASVLALMLHHRDDCQSSSGKLDLKRNPIHSNQPTHRNSPKHNQSNVVLPQTDRLPPADSGNTSSSVRNALPTSNPRAARASDGSARTLAATPPSDVVQDLASHFPRLNVAAAAFTPSSALASVFTPSFASHSAETEEVENLDTPTSEEDEFSPFSTQKRAQTTLEDEVEEVQEHDTVPMMSPFDVFCAMLLRDHADLFGESPQNAPQQIQAALERNHYDVQATMQSLRDARRTNTPLINTSVMNDMPAQDTLGGSRVCRYFLAGECRRSDCRFSHDLNKALCRFWLRGQCLNDPCSFLHDFDALAVLASSLSIEDQPDPKPEDNIIVPGLPRARLDSTQTRWAAAAASSRPSTRADRSAASHPTNRSNTSSSVARMSSHRLALWPPTLLPTLNTGSALASDMAKLRAKHTENTWETTQALITARHAKIREQLLVAAGGDAGGWGSSAQASDERGSQGIRGRPAGGNLGLHLGVARPANIAPYTRHALSMEERMEVFLDLHGLYVNEAVQACERFLLGLEAEHYRGIAYLGVGAGKHSRAKGAKLHTKVAAFLHTWGYVRIEPIRLTSQPMADFEGVIACDPCTHL
ncbi:hypothetical protein MPSI1_002111 [Malassezia psittaci]|uniref:C3H1-type domain-containing protein n=1 Tax=Malassezia psittaci TaxID=1821823 RepID=A0AAF0FAN8_9BASI|nr:hypothetical protein MPSI1_002111 [Malassezia psittaci]